MEVGIVVGAAVWGLVVGVGDNCCVLVVLVLLLVGLVVGVGAFVGIIVVDLGAAVAVGVLVTDVFALLLAKLVSPVIGVGFLVFDPSVIQAIALPIIRNDPAAKSTSIIGTKPFWVGIN